MEIWTRLCSGSLLGVVQTAEGLPIYHEVFDGNVAEVSTLKGTLEKVMQRFAIKRVIAVADRGLLSMDNLAQLKKMKTPVANRWSLFSRYQVVVTMNLKSCSRHFIKSNAKRPQRKSSPNCHGRIYDW